jgi:hypothetical protein
MGNSRAADPFDASRKWVEITRNLLLALNGFQRIFRRRECLERKEGQLNDTKIN